MTSVRLGVAYYPEQWPRERWELDASLMADAGLSIARIGEFAWARLEPRRGAFDFDWLDEAIGILAERGLEVVLGTPTAAPPAWLVEEHPEILPQRADGQVKFGHRRHYCPNQPAFHAATEAIVAALAERFGRDGRVLGWQVDNELGGRCFCDTCADAFRNWLRERYGTLDSLNAAWGTAFWSQTYDKWTQIPFPDLPPRSPNPGLGLDYRRFVSDSYVAYQALQTRILRARCESRQLITTNLMGFGFSELDYHELARDLDVVSWDNYPILDPKQRWTTPALSADAMRGLKSRGVWVMEQQVGPLGWEYLLTPARGQLRLWVFQAIAHGAQAVVFFRWRTARFGTEQHWHGIVDADGETRSRYAQVADLSRELERLAETLFGVEPTARVAVVHDYDSRFAAQVQPTHASLGYEDSVHTHYGALKRLGVDVDVISPSADLSRYRIVVAPNLRVVDETIAERLNAFAAAGGQLVLAPRTAVRDRFGAVPERPLPAWLDAVAGLHVTDYACLDDGVEARFGPTDGARAGGALHGWIEEVDVFDAEVVARFVDGPFTGMPAITHREGTTYVAGCADDATLTNLYTDLCARCELSTIELPPGVEAVRCANDAGELLFLFNHTPLARTIPVDGARRELLSGDRVETTITVDGHDLAVLAPELVRA
jgi:beta-galactosidase